VGGTAAVSYPLAEGGVGRTDIGGRYFGQLQNEYPNNQDENAEGQDSIIPGEKVIAKWGDVFVKS